MQINQWHAEGWGGERGDGSGHPKVKMQKLDFIKML